MSNKNTIVAPVIPVQEEVIIPTDPEELFNYAIAQVACNDMFNMIYPHFSSHCKFGDVLKLHHFEDGEQAIGPKDNETCYFVVQGQVNIIAEEYRFNALMHEMTSARLLRARLKRADDYEEPPPNAPF